MTEANVQGFLSARFGEARNAPTVFVFSPGAYALILMVESASPDSVLGSMLSVLKKSAKTQFTKQRPGLLAVQLHDLTEAQLLGLGERDFSAPDRGNGLQRIATELFNSDSCRHMLSIVFRSHGSLTESRVVLGSTQTTTKSATGPAYVFTNHQHLDAGKPVARLFLDEHENGRIILPAWI